MVRYLETTMADMLYVALAFFDSMMQSYVDEYYIGSIMRSNVMHLTTFYPRVIEMRHGCSIA